MTDEKALTKTNGNAPEVWGKSDEIDGIARRLRAMLPNGERLSKSQLYAAAQYAQLSGLDPFAAGFYAMPGGGIVQHYAVLVAWAQDKAPYSDRYMPLTDDERQDHGVAAPETIAVKCYVMRDDRADVLATYLQAGMPFTEALDFLAAKGIGLVTQADRTTKKGDPMDPPKGWTWEKVAKKRALRDAIKQSHGVPTAAELRHYAEQVYRDTPDGRLEGLERQAIEIAAEAEQMTIEDHRERLAEKVPLMRGEPETGIGESDEDVIDYGEQDKADFANDVITRIPYYKNQTHVFSTLDGLGLQWDVDNAEMLFDALATEAATAADAAAAKEER